jgi:hypothetical protein
MAWRRESGDVGPDVGSRLILGLVLDLFRSQAALEAEVLVLRQQIIVLRRGHRTWPCRSRRFDRQLLVARCRGGLQKKSRRGGAGFSTSTQAIQAALRGFNVREQVAVLMPYSGAPADAVRRYFTELNLSIVREESLSVARPLDLARVSATTIHDALRALDGYGAEILVQFGAALPTMRVVAEAE